MSTQLKYTKLNHSSSIESVLFAPNVNGVFPLSEGKTFIFKNEKGAHANNAPDLGIGESRKAKELSNEYLLSIKRNDPEQAVNVLKRIIQLKPSSSEAYARLGLWYFELNDLVRAAQALEKAIKLNPDNALAQFHLGSVYLTPFLTSGNSSKLRKVIKPVSRAIRAGFYIATAHLYLGIAYTGLKNWQTAEEHLHKAIELDSRLSAAYMKLADLYVELGDITSAERDYYYREAIETYNKLIIVDPKNSDAYNLLGMRYADLGDAEFALQIYEKALANGAEDLVTLASLGTAYLEAKRFEEAKTVLHRIIKTDRRKIYAYIKKKEKNRDVMNRFLADAYTSYGVACLELFNQKQEAQREDEATSGLIQEAESSFKKAIELDPDHINPHFNLGVLYDQQNRIEEAAFEMKRALEIKPGHREAQENLQELEEKLQARAKAKHPLTQLLSLATDMGVTDLAARHDYYAHGRREENADTR
jgi:tetratricopeptide (TPR) repeat protein